MSIYSERYSKFIGKYCEITWVETTEEIKPGHTKPEKHKETVVTKGVIQEIHEPKFGRDYLEVLNDRDIYLDSIKEIHELETEHTTA